MLTQAQKQAYLKASHKCPHCGSEDITGGSLNYEGDGIYQDITCQECDQTWTDVFTLSGIADRDEKEQEHDDE